MRALVTATSILGTTLEALVHALVSEAQSQTPANGSVRDTDSPIQVIEVMPS
jgi:hypothetical protein